ncbi:MAG: NAD(P)-dependent oxidoreductase [Verrucomicrobium sp.]|nr:NAD(P)-dependent oxidoreductase [Verrucomicrobium sp.]
MATEHRVILTGGTGTLGGSFLREAANRPGMRILALRRPGSKTLPPTANIQEALAETLDGPEAAAHIRDFRPTCLVHCAATGMETDRPSLPELVRVNVNASIALCEIAAAVPGCHYVFVSTGLAYQPQERPLREDDPLGTLHPYGATKAAADLLVRSAALEFKVPLTVLRPFSFTGPNDDRTRLFPSILRAAAAGQPMSLSSGSQLRDFCSVRDIAHGLILAAEAGSPEPGSPRVCNLGSGRLESLRSVIERVMGELGVSADLRFGERPPGRFESPCLVADISAAREELKWSPRHNLAHAVWQLARESFPDLQVVQPREQ